MPFSQFPFQGFSDGDLMYGLPDQRSYYINNYPYFSVAGLHCVASTIDHYAGTDSEIGIYKDHSIRIPERQREFLLFTSMHENYKSILDETQDLDEETYYSRKAKAGAMWAIKTKSTVHIILDGANIEEIFKKTSKSSDFTLDADLHKSAFGSVLRMLDRHRHDPKVRSKVKYWLNGEPSKSPRSENPDLLRQYHPKKAYSHKVTSIARVVLRTVSEKVHEFIHRSSV